MTGVQTCALPISWSRLLARGFRDPLVGRDVLAGCLWGAFAIALDRLMWFVPSWLGYPSPQPSSGPEWQFLGARAIVADVAVMLMSAPVFWLAALFVLVLLRALLRKEWSAAVAWVLLFTVVAAAGNQFAPDILVGSLVLNCMFVFLMIRFGLLTLVTNFVFWYVLTNFPLTTQGSAWYAGLSLAGILLLAAIAFYAFYTSLGGRPVFGGSVLEE